MALATTSDSVDRVAGLRRCPRFLPVSRGKDQLSQQPFHAPMQIILKMSGQIIEQLLIRRRASRAADIFRRFDNSSPKQLSP